MANGLLSCFTPWDGGILTPCVLVTMLRQAVSRLLVPKEGVSLGSSSFISPDAEKPPTPDTLAVACVGHEVAHRHRSRVLRRNPGRRQSRKLPSQSIR